MSKPELTLVEARNAAANTYASQYNCDPPRVVDLHVEYDDLLDLWTWSGVVIDPEYGEVEFSMHDHYTECLDVDW